MEAICIIAIAVIAAGVGLFALNRYLKGSKDGTGISEDTVPLPELKPLLKPVSNAVIDARSIEQKYADTHGMWICMYCETMNKYPVGMSARRKVVEESTAISVERKSELRGDLLDKANAHRGNAMGESNVLICIACGKCQ